MLWTQEVLNQICKCAVQRSHSRRSLPAGAACRPMKVAHLWRQTAAFVSDLDDRSALQPLPWPAHRRHPTPPERCQLGVDMQPSGAWRATSPVAESSFLASTEAKIKPPSSRSSPEQDGHHEQVRLPRWRRWRWSSRETETRSSFKHASWTFFNAT